MRWARFQAARRGEADKLLQAPLRRRRRRWEHAGSPTRDVIGAAGGRSNTTRAALTFQPRGGGLSGCAHAALWSRKMTGSRLLTAGGNRRPTNQKG